MPKLRFFDAVFIGLASMIGAGVFVVFGPAAALAGNQLPIAILLAGFMAYLNAGSIGQLAKVVSKSGGAYAYGRHYLGASWGFAAGISFLLGKIGSVAAIALVVSAYLGLGVAGGIASIVLMTVVNLMGVNRTAKVAMLIALLSTGSLLVIGFSALPLEAVRGELQAQPFGVFSAASLIFFAFAGYARVATMGSEVKNGERVISSAISVSLLIVLLIYLFLGAVLLDKLGPDLARSAAPVRDLAELALPQMRALVAPVAAIAGLGSLLALLAGMTRTAAVMAADGELPKVFSRLNAKGVPWVAELTIGALAIGLILSGSVVFTIGLSSFAVLIYYAVANLAAFIQPKTESSRPKAFSAMGFVACLLVAAFSPFQSLVLGGTAILTSLFLRFSLAKLN